VSDYDSDDDVTKCFEASYAAIRERMAAGGPGWTPKMTSGLIPELSENEIQRVVFEHLRTRGAPGIFAFHPKNASADMAGRKAGIHVGLGVEPGIPDVIVIRRRMPDCDVYALELKRESLRGKKKLPSHEDNQQRTRNRMAACGVTVGLAFGLDEAIAWLEKCGLLIGRAA